jgi:hypothetical protein
MINDNMADVSFRYGQFWWSRPGRYRNYGRGHGIQSTRRSDREIAAVAVYVKFWSGAGGNGQRGDEILDGAVTEVSLKIRCRGNPGRIVSQDDRLWEKKCGTSLEKIFTNHRNILIRTS